MRMHLIRLGVLLGIVLSLRLGVFWLAYSADSRCMITVDSKSYSRPALALLKTGRLAATPELPDVPLMYRTPGYPVFIALIYRFFGERPAVVIVAQVIVSSVTVCVVYHLSNMLWGGAAAVVSALLLSLGLESLMLSLCLLTDTLFTLFLMLSVGSGILLGLGKGGRRKWAFLSGLFLGIATLVRPVSYYLIVPIAVGWLAYGLFGGWKRRETAVIVSLLALPFVILIGGWRVRNYCLSGYSDYSTLPGMNLLYYRAGGILARRDGVPFETVRQRLYEEYPRGDAVATSPQMARDCAKEGWKTIKQYPLFFVKDIAHGAVRLLISPGSSGLVMYMGVDLEETDRSGRLHGQSFVGRITRRVLSNPFLTALTAFGLAHLFLSYCGILFVAWRVVRVDRQAVVVHLFVLGVVLYFVLVSSYVSTHSRYRVPIAPLIALYGGGGLSLLIHQYRSWKARRTAERG